MSTTTQDRILAQLQKAEGRFLSGEEMAARLGISRNAVWKAVTALRERGYTIEALPRRGYRLAAAPDKPFAAEVLRGLTGPMAWQVEYVTTTTSTNDEARRRAVAGAPEGLVMVAEEQTGGRGRRGRSWLSPPGLGIWCSLVLRPPLAPREVLPLGLLTAAAARAALAETGLPVAIKWPNDLVLANGLKLGGILMEMGAEAERVHYVIAGVGINVNQRGEDFPGPLAATASSVGMALGRPVPRVPLLRSLLREFAHRYHAALSGGFQSVLAEVRHHCITLGQWVQVESEGEPWLGRALDLTADGALQVLPENAETPVTLYAGDVSIRPAPGGGGR